MHPHTDPASHLIDDVPPLPVVERRQIADRRATWRGGRRDSDWITRPPGALTELERRSVARTRWRWLLTRLNVW